MQSAASSTRRCRSMPDDSCVREWIHDPEAHVEVLRVGEWQVRAVPRGTPRFRRLLRREALHVQLWHPTASVSVVTPSVDTSDCFEVRCAGALPVRVARPPQLHALVARTCGVDLPKMREMALFADWFARAEERRAAESRRRRCRGRRGNPGAHVPANPVVRANDSKDASGHVGDLDALRHCDPASLRCLVLYYVVVTPGRARALAAQPGAHGAGQPTVCSLVAQLYAAATRSREVRQCIDNDLAEILEEEARGLAGLDLAGLAATWRRSSDERSSDLDIVAFLWTVARQPEPWFRKLEGKVRQRVEQSRNWLLVDGASTMGIFV